MNQVTRSCNDAILIDGYVTKFSPALSGPSTGNAPSPPSPPFCIIPKVRLVEGVLAFPKFDLQTNYSKNLNRIGLYTVANTMFLLNEVKS